VESTCTSGAKPIFASLFARDTACARSLPRRTTTSTGEGDTSLKGDDPSGGEVTIRLSGTPRSKTGSGVREREIGVGDVITTTGADLIPGESVVVSVKEGWSKDGARASRGERTGVRTALTTSPLPCAGAAERER
jgi:hypothetical protein